MVYELKMFNIVPSVKDKLMSLLWWVINTDLSNTEANLNAPFCLARQLLLRVGLSSVFERRS